MATKHNTVLALDFDEAEILGPDVNVVWKTVVNVMSSHVHNAYFKT